MGKKHTRILLDDIHFIASLTMSLIAIANAYTFNNIYLQSWPTPINVNLYKCLRIFFPSVPKVSC